MSKKATPGGFLKFVRLAKDETLRVIMERGRYSIKSQGTLSRIENGFRRISRTLGARLVRAYALDEQQKADFFKLLEETNPPKGNGSYLQISPRVQVLDDLCKLSKGDRDWVLAALSGIEQK